MSLNWIKSKFKKTPGIENSEKKPLPFTMKLFWVGDFALIVALILELFVFNYASLTTIKGGYTNKALDLSSAVTTDLKNDSSQPNTYTATSVRPTIEFDNIDQKVRTLYVDASTDKDKRFEFKVELSYTDSTRSQFNHSPKELRIVPEIDRTKYTTCAYFGDTGNLKLTFQTDVGETIHINSVGVNYPIPYNFSYIRIFLIVLTSCAIYTLIHAKSFQIPYRKNNLVQNITILFVAVIILASISGIFFLYCSPPSDPFNQTSGDQVSQELVDAFENGQVSLIKTPSKDLLEMQNPYDYNARINQKISFEWDHVLYNGKYYSYYGIAPVLLLFLPYHLLTRDYYFPSYLACYIFSLVGVAFLFCAYFAMIRNWFKKTPFRIVICGLIVLSMSCGILFCVERPMFYEMEEAAGFMFFTTGVFSLFQSGVLTSRKIKLSALAIAAVCISLAVLSRPTFALYAVALLFWPIFGFLQYHKMNPEKSKSVKYFIAAFLPYVLLGGMQMVYNHLRFGSFLEFGIRYSLTINDFTHSEFYPELAFVSFWNLLFCIPVVKSTFPFFNGNLDQWGLNGYYFAETGNSFGLFWRALPLFSFIAAPRILRRINWRNKLKAFVLFAAPGLIVPILVILSTWESGHALRYNVDFAWQMLFLAFAMIFYMYNRIQSESLKRVLSTALICCTVWTVVSTTALVFQSVPGITNTIFFNRENTILYYKIGRTLEFWN